MKETPKHDQQPNASDINGKPEILKKENSIKVRVIEVHKVEGSDSKNYLTAIYDGKKLIPAGRTDNTKISANVGDYVKVVFVELSKYTDPKTKEIRYNFWSPKVVNEVSNADSSQTAEALVKKTGGQVAEKPFPIRYKNLCKYVGDHKTGVCTFD